MLLVIAHSRIIDGSRNLSIRGPLDVGIQKALSIIENSPESEEKRGIYNAISFLNGEIIPEFLAGLPNELDLFETETEAAQVLTEGIKKFIYACSVPHGYFERFAILGPCLDYDGNGNCILNYKKLHQAIDQELTALGIKHTCREHRNRFFVSFPTRRGVKPCNQ